MMVFLMPAFMLALFSYVLLAAGFLHGIFPVWNSAIPGGLEDTRIFLWNAWWVHHALKLGLNPYHTQILFYPFGASLISHDFPLWMNLVTEAAQRSGMSLAGACNLWFLITWVLGAACTFLLAREVSGRAIAAWVAGLYVMTHSYTLARAMQNWGQFNLYGIALFLWALMRARRTGKIHDFLLAGAALAWTAACHYYFLIYSGLVWALVAVLDTTPREIHILWRRRHILSADKLLQPVPTPAWRSWALVTAAMAAGAAAAIMRHPGEVSIGRVIIGLHGPENALLVMWTALMVWGLSYFRFATTPRRYGHPAFAVTRHGILLAAALVCLSPLLWAVWNLFLAGGYPKQTILWKTHLPGANFLAVFMPNALHALWGPAVSRWFLLRELNPQEQAAAIGWVCLGVIGISHFRQAYHARVRWLWLALAATVCSLGTYLHIAQWNLWCPLPFYVLRLLPVLGNVRVPERWMALGAVSWGVVLALALVELARQKRWPLRLTCLGVGLLVLAENWPGIPIAPMPAHLSVYDTLRAQPEGAVLPLPFYIGDSSIGAGDALPSKYTFPWDHLGAQIYHEKPVLGGFIGRIPRKLIGEYRKEPFMDSLLKVEEGEAPPKSDPVLGAQAVRALGIRYVLVYPAATRPEALRYVLESLPLEPIELRGDAQLYRVVLTR